MVAPALALAGNRAQSPQDVAFLRAHACGDLLASLGKPRPPRPCRVGEQCMN
jgi:hypothetical protein